MSHSFPTETSPPLQILLHRLRTFNNNGILSLEMIVGFEVITEAHYPHASQNSALVTSDLTFRYFPLKLSTVLCKPSKDILVLNGDGSSSIQMTNH